MFHIQSTWWLNTRNLNIFIEVVLHYKIFNKTMFVTEIFVLFNIASLFKYYISTWN